MNYQVVLTARFKKDSHLAKKQGKDLKKLSRIIDLLAEGRQLPKENKDHFLKGSFKGYRECYIESDWLLTLSDRRRSAHSDTVTYWNAQRVIRQVKRSTYS